MTSNPPMYKQPAQTNPTFTYRASNISVLSNGTEQVATGSPSLWRKFQRRISHDHSKVPVAYVKPSQRYSLELSVLEDDEEEEGEEEENEVGGSLTASSNLAQEDENSQNDTLNKDSNQCVNRLTANNSLAVSLETKDERRKEKISFDENKVDLTHDEILDRIREIEPDEQFKDGKEEKKSRGRARKSKKTKQGYQRSISAFAFFDMNDDETNNEDVEEEKGIKKKEKGSKALSLKRHIIRKMSQTSMAFSGSPTEEVLPHSEEGNNNNLDNQAIDEKESKSVDSASEDVFYTQVRFMQNKNIENYQPSQRHSLPDINDGSTEVPSSFDKPLFRVGTFDDSIRPAETLPESESSVIVNDDPGGPSLEKTFGSQPDISSKMSSSNSPGKTRRNGTVTKSISTSRSMTSASLLPPPLTLTESRSLNALNEQGSMDGENMSPRRKVAGTWDVDDFQPDEEEKKKKKWSAKLGGFARRFGGGASVLQHAVTHSDADGLQKLLQDSNNRNEINNTKTMGVTIFHQACVFGDINIIQMLLSNGADVNLKTWSKLSPLKIAVTFGHFDAAKLLVESGADQFDIINGYQMNIADVPEWT